MFRISATPSLTSRTVVRLSLGTMLALLLAACGCGTGDSQDQVLGASSGTPQTQGALQITTESVPAGSPGVAYRDTQLTADGAQGPVTWTVAGGTLPPGLRLTDDGRVVGVPASAGFYEFTPLASDGVQQDARTLAIAVDVFGLGVADGLHFGDAWTHHPVSLRTAGAAGPVRFEVAENGSGGSFRAMDTARGTASWVPGAALGAGAIDRLRATDTASGETIEVRLPVVSDPTENHTARIGTTDVWHLDFTVKHGRHPYASDFHAALALLGLRSPDSTQASGREVDDLCATLVQVEVLRALNPMYLRQPDGSEGARGLAISFALERPGSGYDAPAAGGTRPARANGYSVMAVCDQSASRGAYGVAFLDRLGNPNQEHNAPGGPTGEMGVFINVIAQSVARTYRLHGDEFVRRPVEPADFEALKALLHGQPNPGGRYRELAYQVRALARSVACVAAHEIAHSLGAPHLEEYTNGGIMNGVGVIGPGMDYFFVPQTLDVLRAGLRGSGGDASVLEPSVAALSMAGGVHVCGACQGR